jgi:hypothetical protein
VVLAKGGIRLPAGFDSVPEQNQEILRLFFSRTPDTRIGFESLTGIRDIIESDADLVRKAMSRRVNMEYDWKRKPDLLFDHRDYKHCAFSTKSWDTVEQFQMVRELFEKYLETHPHCIKSIGDFDSFSIYVDANMQMPDDQRRYLKKRSGDLKRLRMALCSAWHESKLGVRSNPTITSAREFSEALSACGVPCSRPDVENGRKKNFELNSVPPTEGVMAAIMQLHRLFSEVDAERLCSMRVASLSVRPSRRPGNEIRRVGGAYYSGYLIPGVDRRIMPALQSSADIKKAFVHPETYIEPSLKWLTREEYRQFENYEMPELPPVSD